MYDNGSNVLGPRREEVQVVMQFLQSVECPISHKLDCLEKCDHQNFFKVQEEILSTMQISLSVGSTFSP